MKANKLQHIRQTRGNYYAVLAIPKALQPQFEGHTQKVAALRTSDPTKAKRLGAKYVSDWRDEFEAASKNLGSPMEQRLDAFLTARVTENLVKREFINRLVSSPFTPTHTFDHDTGKIVRLDGKQPISVDAADLVGSVRTLIKSVFQQGPISETQKLELFKMVMNPEATGASRKTTPFLRHLAHFEEHTAIKGKNLSQTVTTIKDFAREVARPIEQLEGGHVQQWLHDMKSKKDRSKPADKGTKVRKLYELRTYWAHMTSMGWVPKGQENPFNDRITANKETKSEATARKRQTYKPAEIPGLWQRAEADDDASLAAVIKLSAYSGARLGEIMNLKRDHIETMNDIRCIKIMIGKTPKAARWFPIHPDILDLVSKLERHADTDGHLIHATAMHRSAAMSQRFGRMKKVMGYGPLHTEHSIRHTVIQSFREIRCPIEVRNLMLGHEDGDEKPGAGAAYGDLTPQGRLEWMVQAIVY